MRILVTNDDGINAAGLKVLEAIALSLSDDVWVVAPADEQSGAGHSLSLAKPMRVRKLGERRFAVQGTPTDCVMMACGRLVEGRKPDLLLSGVNRGANLAEDVTYSGTVSAAMEGALIGVRSIALSQAIIPIDKGWDDVNAKGDLYSAATAHGAAVVRKLLEAPCDDRVLINVNFPPVPGDQVKGVRVTEQGFRQLAGIPIDERKDPRGYSYYWFGFAREVGQPGHETDLKAMREGYVSVTPLHLEMTHRPTFDALRASFE